MYLKNVYNKEIGIFSLLYTFFYILLLYALDYSSEPYQIENI